MVNFQGWDYEYLRMMEGIIYYSGVFVSTLNNGKVEFGWC